MTSGDDRAKRQEIRMILKVFDAAFRQDKREIARLIINMPQRTRDRVARIVDRIEQERQK